MLNIDSMLLDTNSFIPFDMAIAPKHPLAKNLELPIPNPRTAKPATIRAIQLRDRIPGVVKRLIPLDASVSWEYWWCVPGRLLLPEDVELLNRDRARIESILSQLVWLFGACCFGNDSNRHGEQQLLHDWQEVLAFVRQQGFESYLLDIDFFPLAVKLHSLEAEDASDKNAAEYVAVEPAHWHIEFFHLQPANGGFDIQEPKSLCSCQIWAGRPFLRHRKTGEAVTRYDLWVSHPYNVTTPSWLP